MTSSRKEFFRLLPLALADYEFVVDGNSIHFTYANGKLSIDITKETERKIASLALPVLHVSFTFVDIDHQSQQNFLNHFFKVYQRGGG